MKELFITVLCLSLISSVLLFVCEDMRFKKIIEWGIGLVFVSVIINPVISLARDFDFIVPELDMPEGGIGYIEYTEDAFKEGIRAALCEKYGIEGEDVLIECQGFDFSSMSCEKITVTLKGKAAMSDSASIKEYLKKSLCKECYVHLEFG